MYATKTIMPYGRYGGLPIVRLRTDYLLWLLTVHGLQADLRRAADGAPVRRGVPETTPGELR